MRRIIKERDDIKVSIFSGDRLARVFIDSGYRNIAMVIADCNRIANGCYHIHHIEVVNMDRGWGVEFDEDDDEIYILYKRIIREVFFKMCEDMKVC